MSEFNPDEFSDRYEFRDGKVFNRSNGTQRHPLVQPSARGAAYRYYNLTDNAGRRRRFSETVVRAYEDDNGSLWWWDGDLGDGWREAPECPGYLINHNERRVMRVAWCSPRTNPTEVKSHNGVFRMRRFDGEYRHYTPDQLFA